jgi:hypothetical protein
MPSLEGEVVLVDFMFVDFRLVNFRLVDLMAAPLFNLSVTEISADFEQDRNYGSIQWDEGLSIN